MTMAAWKLVWYNIKEMMVIYHLFHKGWASKVHVLLERPWKPVLPYMHAQQISHGWSQVQVWVIKIVFASNYPSIIKTTILQWRGIPFDVTKPNLY